MEIQRLVGAGSSGRSVLGANNLKNAIPVLRIWTHSMYELAPPTSPSVRMRDHSELYQAEIIYSSGGKKKRKKNCLAMHMAICVHNNSLIPIGSFPHLVTWPAGKWREPGT